MNHPETPLPSFGTILTFWFEETAPKLHFKKDNAFDAEIAERFGDVWRAASDGALDFWAETADGALALIIVLDQFTRNLHRKSPMAFSQDEKALDKATAALVRGFDMDIAEARRSFFYMPFMHAEKLLAQEQSVELFKTRLPGKKNIKFAEEHRDIIQKFGRFPHRNEVLGRQSTEAEQFFLAKGGFNPG